MDTFTCTCQDLQCKLHPANHTKGCDLCIQKNLKMGEIPSCFFNAVTKDVKTLDDFSYESFAKIVMKK